MFFFCSVYFQNKKIFMILLLASNCSALFPQHSFLKLILCMFFFALQHILAFHFDNQCFFVCFSAVVFLNVKCIFNDFKSRLYFKILITFLVIMIQQYIDVKVLLKMASLGGFSLMFLKLLSKNDKNFKFLMV